MSELDLIEQQGKQINKVINVVDGLITFIEYLDKRIHALEKKSLNKNSFDDESSVEVVSGYMEIKD